MIVNVLKERRPVVTRGRIASTLVTAALVCATAGQGVSAVIDFQQEIRPILSSTCFACHGPDEAHREAGLRLDTENGAKADLGGYAAVVPGDAAKSALIKRITSADPDVRMPPPDSGKELTPEQIESLRQWIAEGARWGRHWAFIPPTKPSIPAAPSIRDALTNRDAVAWITNAIDAFVLARLVDEDLAPEPPAERPALLRRLSLDLIGLPPTIEEIDAFLADQSADAYQKQVERLLKSPHYGERWGRVWLDAARYADSDGFEKDKPRRVWMYRDWVVRALNQDQPYNEFLIDQIAGDLRPDATQDQLVATGFLRNSMLNEEGGIDPEQFRMEAMFDRMDALGKAVLGLTIQCGQCHSHKYDPLSQTEYYRMFAFLNNSHESNVTVYTKAEQVQRNDVLGRIQTIEETLKSHTPDWRERIAAWAQQANDERVAWTVLPIQNANDNAQRYFAQPDGSLLAQGYAPTKLDAQFKVTTNLPAIRAFRLETLTDPNLPAGGPGRSVDGLFALSEFQVEAASAADPSRTQWVTFIRAMADFSNEPMTLDVRYSDKQGKRGETGPIEYAIDGKDETAWGVDAGAGRRNQPRQAVFVADKNVAYAGGTVLTFHLVQKHGGWNSDDNQNMNLGRFRLSTTGAATIPDAVLPPNIAGILKRLSEHSFADLTAQAQDSLFSYYRMTVSDWSAENAEIERAWSRHPQGTTQLVLAERSDPRTTHRLDRGDFLKQREAVTPGVPAFLHPLQADSSSRLDFAKWLADRSSPTTARALVNRVWQAYFGRGLVETPDDFGLRGAAPTHPELLDWLAVEFMEQGWSLKRLHRLIVTSSTYRQSSVVTDEKQRRDPDNRWLSRGPRFRVDAEVVRDIALTASGLLNRDVGGPPVYPPAPDFLFRPPASYGPKTWNRSSGHEKYRRALYTFRFRSVPYPALEAFDAPNADIACVRRSRSNTPLQALTTLNEPLFVECAQALATSTLQHGGATDEERLTHAFRRCLTRRPNEREREILLRLFRSTRSRFSGSGEQALELVTPVDNVHSTESHGSAPTDLAAWTVVCRVLLNLDETITKE